MKTVILAGGKGTRLSEETTSKPKPMVEIGGKPIIEHIMDLYDAHGHHEFVVACGYLGHVIKQYFANYRMRTDDFTVSLGSGEISFHGAVPERRTVSLVDTGPDTMTGGRLARLKSHLQDGTFMMTYGDGVSDVDVTKLVEHHKASGRIATVTAVRPPARFGSLVFGEGSEVKAFEEKITSGESLINGGFFVLEPEVFGYVGDDTMPFEREPMERLAADGQLSAFIHDGFWQPMDTLRDKLELQQMVEDGTAPWIRPNQL